MIALLLSYIAVLVVLVTVDLVWLGVVALDFYQRHLSPLLRQRPRLSVAALFYAIYAAGITLLVVQPALNGGDWLHVALLGMVLGLSAYGAYDLTNLATLRHWPARVAVVDLAWGTALTAIAALAGLVIGRLGLGAAA
jgi:uncharacterized membrane protein